MEENVAKDVIVQQRFQDLEARLWEKVNEVDKLASRLEGKEQELLGARREVEMLTVSLSTVQAEKLRLESTQQTERDRSSTEFWDSAANAEVAVQLRALTNRLDMALAERSVVSTENVALEKELQSHKDQLRIKAKEIKEMENKLKESEADGNNWREHLIQRDAVNADLKHEMDRRMAEWFQKEEGMTKALGDALIQRDALKTELEKKIEELDHAEGILKETQTAFAECLAEYENLQSGQGILDPMLQEPHMTGMTYPLQQFEPLRRYQTLSSVLQQEEDLEGLCLEEVKEKYQELVQRYNKNVRAGLLDNRNMDRAAQDRSRMISDNKALTLDLQNMKKVADERAGIIRSMTEKNEAMDRELHQARTAAVEHESFIQALQKTNDDYSAQLKFLLKRLRTYEKAIKDGARSLMHAHTMESAPSADGSMPICIHDVIEANKALTLENYKLKYELETYSKSSESQEGNDAQSEQTETQQRQEVPDNLQTQKRAAVEQPEPVRKKRRTSEMETIDTDEEQKMESDESKWKIKWEKTEKELSTVRVTHLHQQTALKQELERVKAINAQYEKDIKELEHNLMDYQTKYNALLELNGAYEENFKAQMDARTENIKNLDTVIQAMSAEIDGLKGQLNKEKEERAVDQHKLQEERTSYNNLQERTILMEQEYLQKMNGLRESCEAQIAENIRSLTAKTASDGESSKNVQEVIANAVQSLQQQLSDKDQVIAELQRQMQSTLNPLNRDAIYELESKLSAATAQVEIDRDQIRMLETALKNAREQFDVQIQSVKEELQSSMQMKDQEISKLESERDAQNLEILRYKGQCDQHKAIEQDLRRELSASRRDQDNALRDLAESLEKSQEENASLKKAVEERSIAERAHTLRNAELERDVNLLNERLEKSMAERAEALQTAAAAARRPVQVPQESIPDDAVDGNTETAKDTPAEPEVQGTINTQAAQNVDLGTPSVAGTERKSESPDHLSSMIADNKELSSLLAKAKPVVHSTTEQQTSPTTPSAENKSPESGAHGHPEDGGSETPGSQGQSRAPTQGAESSKPKDGAKRKWPKIVYDPSKRDDHSDGKDRGRGPKF